MAELAVTALKLDQVRFIPCQISPHKIDSPTAVEDRLEMARLATTDYSWAVVDDIESKQPGPSYSWQTAEAIKQQFPDAQLFWIMGTDQWNTLPKWAEPERLAACTDFIVCTRGEAKLDDHKFNYRRISFQHPASATQIRSEIASGTKHHPWLTKEVSAYIAEHGIYQP